MKRDKAELPKRPLICETAPAWGRFFIAVVLAILFGGVSNAEDLAAGKFLVATEDVDGSRFARTVILLLHYDEFGAQGLVINRRSEARLGDVFPDSETLADYDGALYWGGPVSITTMRALLRSDTPPKDAVPIFGNVYQVPMDETLGELAMDDDSLRFYLGYSGWAPGQLERELRFGSWDVVPSTEDAVFSSEPDSVWQSLSPVRQYRAQQL